MRYSNEELDLLSKVLSQEEQTVQDFISYNTAINNLDAKNIDIYSQNMERFVIRAIEIAKKTMETLNPAGNININLSEEDKEKYEQAEEFMEVFVFDGGR